MQDSRELLKELKINRNDDDQGWSPTLKWGLGIGLLAAVAVGAFLYLRESAVPVQTALAVKLGTNASGGNASVLDATGYVVARRMATVSSKITGRVREVLIQEGMRIEQDQVMATLDPIDAEAQLNLSRSQLAAARSLSGSVRAQLVQAEANAKRVSALFDKRLVARSLLDEAIAARDSLRAQLIDSEQNAKVAQDQLRIAENGLDNTIVRAPFAGVVIARAAQPGEIVSPLSAGGGFTRTGIGTIVDMDSLEIEVDVGEAYIGRVTAGMPVEAVLNAYPDWRIPAAVIATIPAADRGKATVKVRIGFKEKDDRVVPDMGVRVSFLEPEIETKKVLVDRGVMVAGGAVVQRDGKDVVFTLQDGRATQTEVKIARRIGDDVEVSAGLNGGETVIVDPPEGLTNGSLAAPQAKSP
ncbi:efflux RND transporter periplasmic adaptor subunit [Ahniella affigens]|uniref:Efflux RND transporter periplasmic adaptor subunit n=1 Tax=Ahniella affigens TaxID=2021234 RepID=A0A2P1PQM3_9GAMM|nr:efflux RND transporter periplasmic adaptor subunit [Ahniella affigens]AVP97132.1 efflux RND transporter periplasmic adaptor subunit [Ahniella affigens]